MINDKELVDFIISEYRKLHGELILQRTIFETREPFDTSKIKDFADFFEKMTDEKKLHDDLQNLMEYNRGKMDAYTDIMELLGFNEKKSF